MNVWRWAPTSNDWRWTSKKLWKTLFMKICFWFFVCCCSFSHTREKPSLSELAHSSKLCLVFRHRKSSDDVIFSARNVRSAIWFYARSSSLCCYHKKSPKTAEHCLLLPPSVRGAACLVYDTEWMRGNRKTPSGILSKIIVNVISRIRLNHRKTVRHGSAATSLACRENFIWQWKFAEKTRERRKLALKKLFLFTNNFTKLKFNKGKNNRKHWAEKKKLCNVWENRLSAFMARTDVVVSDDEREEKSK